MEEQRDEKNHVDCCGATSGGCKYDVTGDTGIARISCILCGIIFVVVGNYMTKAKRKTVVGFRTAWSMYNDNTWRKSNRFGAISIVVAGVLTIITAAFANGITSTILLLVYLLSATIIAILYSKKVYDQEKREV